MTSEQFSLFDDVETIVAQRDAEHVRAEAAAAYREWANLDCCTAYTKPIPPRKAPAGDWNIEQTRCGRCADTTSLYDMTISHDTGYTGCSSRDPLVHGGVDHLGRRLVLYVEPLRVQATDNDPQWYQRRARLAAEHANDHRYQWPMTTAALSLLRHDRLHWPDCERCGHAWGIHTQGSGRNWAPENSRCNNYCGCPGYIGPSIDDLRAAPTPFSLGALPLGIEPRCLNCGDQTTRVVAFTRGRGSKTHRFFYSLCDVDRDHTISRLAGQRDAVVVRDEAVTP